VKKTIARISGTKQRTIPIMRYILLESNQKKAAKTVYLDFNRITRFLQFVCYNNQYE